jgi:hypothetical protein
MTRASQEQVLADDTGQAGAHGARPPASPGRRCAFCSGAIVSGQSTDVVFGLAVHARCDAAPGAAAPAEAGARRGGRPAA